MTDDPLASDDASRLFDLLAGKWRAQAVSTAAALGLGDLLADGPRHATDLARATGTDAARLARLLAVLVGLELLN